LCKEIYVNLGGIKKEIIATDGGTLKLIMKGERILRLEISTKKEEKIISIGESTF
jgi:hypothetical protein